MKKNPIEITEYIDNEFSKYIKSTYSIDNEDYQPQLLEELKSIDLYNGPYLHAILPFEKGDSIRQLIEKGILSKEFTKFSNINLDRRLYVHQQNSIIKANSGRNLVVTTGTGSGKTECFLYPILNHIMKSIEAGKKGIGVKAVFLYPMNALVNDQMDRLRSLLASYPNITYGSYTGDTPEERTAKIEADAERLADAKIPTNELLSRKEMRENPPDLLFTNYSMLEYLLIRPTDYSIIKPEMMKNWQFIVLDEAHSYHGTQGIEISSLLKRFVGIAEKTPQFILTSATLGDTSAIKDIITFANNLTAVEYTEDDVIFSSRKPLDPSFGQYYINPEDYQLLKDNLGQRSTLISVAKKYVSINLDCSDGSILYYLLRGDKTVYMLFDAIHNTNTYTNVKQIIDKSIMINNQQLTALIQLISLADDHGTVLYDAKFHMFVSAPNRAFITLGANKHLAFGNHVEIEGMKAFEFGVCRNCGHLYIFGNVVNGVLEPEDTVDIYENYDEQYEEKIDFFCLEKEEEIQDLEEYLVCSKCGHIFRKANLNAEHCDCGEEYLIPIYRVNNDNGQKKNNLCTCVHCGQSNSTGIIDSFHLNKDAATSVLAQMFYEGMEDGISFEKGAPSEPSEDLFSSKVETRTTPVEAKQLLAFSDSRQQASFFSVFFKYNHERFLRRRLVWNSVKNENSVSVRSLAARLTEKIRYSNPFDDDEIKAQSQAWISILIDMLFADGQYSSDGIALYTYSYDFDKELEAIQNNKDKIKAIFGLDVEQFLKLIQLTVNRFRHSSAIDYNAAELSDHEKNDSFQYAGRENYFEIKKSYASQSYESKFIKSFLPVKEESSNITIDYLMRICHCSHQEAISLAEKLFNFMKNIDMFSERTLDGRNVYQVPAEKFVVQPYIKHKWYICNKCKRLTIYNINDVCPEKECEGHLTLCDPDAVDADNYYRKEYMSDKIEKITVREHTAQLSRERAREYQKEFKNKKINILSSSTTFEMGVDIGTLENVFLRNVPPTPANYVQRAGRAGRSKNAAALVLTYCGNSSHDYSYFHNPEELIEGRINPPLFNVSNPKIIIRHILATALGFYFRIKPEMYKNIDEFIYDDKMQGFKDYIASKPKSLGEFVDKYLLAHTQIELFKNYGWVKQILDENSKLNQFIREIVEDHQILSLALNEAMQNKDFDGANYYSRRLKAIEKESVISVLSEYAVIPKYGFPVDVVGLNVMENTGRNTDLNLQRDLSIAVSEYAPESEVVVDGNKYVSRYINMPKGSALPRYYYYICRSCSHMEISLTPFDENKTCENCGSPIGKLNSYFIVPEYGFSTDKNSKKSRTMRPRKTYAGEVKYLGGGDVDEHVFKYRDRMEIRTVTNDQLVIINENPFYYCPKCGYTEIKPQMFQPSLTEKSTHRNSFGSKCENVTMYRTGLGHIFRTDVVRIKLMKPYLREEYLTLAYAIAEGISHELQIERNDINCLVTQDRKGLYEIILFDNVPGGAGHVKRIVNTETLEQVLRCAYRIVTQGCCDEETTCYRCLRNYYNQKYHKVMKRKYAIKMLTDLLSE